MGPRMGARMRLLGFKLCPAFIYLKAEEIKGKMLIFALQTRVLRELDCNALTHHSPDTIAVVAWSRDLQTETFS